MQRLEVSGAVRHIYGSLGVKRLLWSDAVLKVCVSTVTSVVSVTSRTLVTRRCLSTLLLAALFRYLCFPEDGMWDWIETFIKYSLVNLTWVQLIALTLILVKPDRVILQTKQTPD